MTGAPDATTALALERNGRLADHPVSAIFLDRWSPRSFSAEPMAREMLMTIFEAARWAPSAFNSQPWRFAYALRDTPAWRPFLEALIPYNQAWAQNASALVFVCSKATFVSPGKTEPRTSQSASFDAGAAWASLAFQAEALGLAAHGMTGFDAQAARGVIKAPDDVKIEAAVAIGKRAVPAAAGERPNGRRPLAESVFEGELR